jgi:hypothetical protein
MTMEKNKALVRRFFEDAPYHPPACAEIFAERVPWHALYRTDQPELISDPMAEKEAYARHIQLWGSWSEHINEMIAKGDRVMVGWTFNGKHEGECLGVPLTHKPVIISGIYIFRVTNQRIAEVWNLWDQLGEWQQLGLAPTSPITIHLENKPLE